MRSPSIYYSIQCSISEASVTSTRELHPATEVRNADEIHHPGDDNAGASSRDEKEDKRRHG